MALRDRLFTFSTLVMLVFLSFYVFGLVMGVYAPGDVPYFTVPAIVFAVLVLAQRLKTRRDPHKNAVTPEARHLRETRGF